MTLEDVEGVDACSTAAFDDLGRRTGRADSWPPSNPDDHRRNRTRVAHLVRQDPQGCWVAEAEEGIVGAGLAILREGLWGLSLLVVTPEHQGVGVGGVLLERTLAYGEGGRAGIILSSDDPAAIRRYRHAGFDLRPAMVAAGSPPAPGSLAGHSGVRQGDAGDYAMCEEIGRRIRGASHGSDLRALVDSDCSLLVVEDRGFCLHVDGFPRLLAAADEEAARSLLIAMLAATPDGRKVFIPFLDERQGWAIDTALACGLRVSPGGPVFVRGELGPMTPYIPSGAYL